MRNNAYMTSAELKRLCIKTFGKEPGNQKKMAKAIGKTPQTVTRWITGESPIGKSEAILIRYVASDKTLTQGVSAVKTDITLEDLL